MNEKLNQYVRLILNEELRKVVGDYLKGFGEELYNCPASTAFHHAYRGGLVDHTMEMCKLGLSFLKVPELSALNKDYLLASIILHDLGKIGRYEFLGEKIVYSSLENSFPAPHSAGLRFTMSNICSLRRDKELVRIMKENTLVYATILFALAVAGELDQRLRGYLFNVNQLLDLSLHHEHLIILCIIAGLILIMSSRSRQMKQILPNLRINLKPSKP